MSTRTLQVVGGDRVLPRLRTDLRGTRASLLIVGPWLDVFFGETVASEAPRDVAVRVLARPEQTAGIHGWAATVECMQRLRAPFTMIESRHLERLHAKCIVIDDTIAFVGSANWYRHSLEQARELVVRGSPAEMPGLADAVAAMWEDASIEAVVSTRTAAPDRAIAPRPEAAGRSSAGAHPDLELLDPIARRVLEADPKAFVLRRK